MRKQTFFRYGLGILAIGLSLGLFSQRVEADVCSTNDVKCAAEDCGVWYDPPNNCSYTNTHCVYYAPSELTTKNISKCRDPNVRCDPPGCENTTNCKWDDVYGCQIDFNIGGTSCQYCFNQKDLCDCPPGPDTPCCVFCSNGSGCGSDGGGGGSSPTPTPSGCVPGLPSSPTLTSPDDGAVLTETTVELSWQPPSEWNDCDGTHEDLAPLPLLVGSRGGALLRPGTHTEPQRARRGDRDRARHALPLRKKSVQIGG